MTITTVKQISGAKKTKWSNPIPFVTEPPLSKSYPTDALPSAIQDAVLHYQNYGQQPISLIACSALANVSLSCQAIANVARDKLLISPASLFFLVVASSGERKSAADKIFGQAIRNWELKIRENLQDEVRAAKALHQSWRAQRAGLLSKIRRATSDSLLNANTLESQYIELMDDEPIIPLLPMLFFEDTTQEALAHHLANGWPSSSLWSDEGGIVLSGHGMQSNSTKFIALLNRLWDGKDFIAHRKTTENFIVQHRRLTLNLMMQPLILEQLLAKNDNISRHSGFLARCLITYPESQMGERFYKDPPQSSLAINTFNNQIHKCLNQSLSLDRKGCKYIKTIQLSKPAKKIWVKFFNEIELGLKQKPHLILIKDFASKAAENVARLAGLFHIFEGKDQDIASESLEQAIEIIDWHLNETNKIMNSTNSVSKNHDATKLLQWLLHKGHSSVTTRHLRQFSPIRDKNTLNSAIDQLVSHRYITENTIDGKFLYQINPYSKNFLT